MPAPIALSPVPAGPHCPLNVGTLELLLASSGRLLGFGEPEGPEDREVSLPSRLEAIPCNDDHDVSHRPVARVLGDCDPNRFGDLVPVFLILSESRVAAEALEGYLLGIGEAPRSDEVDGVRLGSGASAESCS